MAVAEVVVAEAVEVAEVAVEEVVEVETTTNLHSHMKNPQMMIVEEAEVPIFTCKQKTTIVEKIITEITQENIIVEVVEVVVTEAVEVVEVAVVEVVVVEVETTTNLHLLMKNHQMMIVKEAEVPLFSCKQ